MTTILSPTTLAVLGPNVFSVAQAFALTPITCTQVNALANTPINSAAQVGLMFSDDDGLSWLVVKLKTFTLDDPTDTQTFSAFEIQYAAARVYANALDWYVGMSNPVFFVPETIQARTFQAPWTHFMLIFYPPLGDTPGLAVTVSATTG